MMPIYDARDEAVVVKGYCPFCNEQRVLFTKCARKKCTKCGQYVERTRVLPGCSSQTRDSKRQVYTVPPPMVYPVTY